MSEREARKFDPARASVLDAADRDAYLPDGVVVDLLDLAGGETVVDYGAGTGRVAAAVAARLRTGRVIAVDESPEMIGHLTERLRAIENAEVIEIHGNAVPLDDGSVDRIVAVNLLHEVRGERALGEMRRLLAPDGFVLVVDWDRDRPSEPGPPAHLRYALHEAQQECERAGFAVEQVTAELPYHFVLRARPAA
jgi:ubiquinone/menaquinone biosynthesis C-methylase UbiE